ncbi:MAG: GNAT family N-acetyltransferase [Hyphomicrobiales bacterium]|nr:MAG: GNAT family N-acetyltransferase [Hyphomicrobiales bacterium]
MSVPLDIRLANPGDRQELIDLLWRASLAWEVVRQELLDHPEVVDVDPELIARNQIFVAQRGDRIVGFATIVPHEGNDAELDGIFVEPSAWRQGIGMALMHQIEREAKAWSANRLHVLASPNVVGFYTAAGFERTGEQKMRFGPAAIVMVKPVA